MDNLFIQDRKHIVAHKSMQIHFYSSGENTKTQELGWPNLVPIMPNILDASDAGSWGWVPM